MKLARAIVCAAVDRGWIGFRAGVDLHERGQLVPSRPLHVPEGRPDEPRALRRDDRRRRRAADARRRLDGVRVAGAVRAHLLPAGAARSGRATPRGAPAEPARGRPTASLHLAAQRGHADHALGGVDGAGRSVDGDPRRRAVTARRARRDRGPERRVPRRRAHDRMDARHRLPALEGQRDRRALRRVRSRQPERDVRRHE